MHKRDFVRMALAAGFAQLAGPSFGQTWPSRPVKVIVPYPAGGPFDAIMRLVSQPLSEDWKQPIVIDNKPGANEGLGAEAVIQSPPDGHTFLLCTEGAVILNPLLFKKLTYDPQQLSPVSHLVSVPMVLVVPSSLPVSDVRQFIEFAKRKRDNSPNYGSGGIGNPTHLSMSKFIVDNGLDMVHIPYKGGAAMIQAMLSGEIEAMMLSPASVAPHVKSGKFKALAVSGSERLGAMPTVPTLQESGIKDIDGDTMLGLFCRVGTPESVRERVSISLRQILMNADFRARNLSPFGYRPVASTPQEFAAYLRGMRDRQAEKVRVSGARLD